MVRDLPLRGCRDGIAKCVLCQASSLWGVHIFLLPDKRIPNKWDWICMMLAGISLYSDRVLYRRERLSSCFFCRNKKCCKKFFDQSLVRNVFEIFFDYNRPIFLAERFTYFVNIWLLVRFKLALAQRFSDDCGDLPLAFISAGMATDFSCGCDSNISFSGSA